jgi:hypothetical protein
VSEDWNEDGGESIAPRTSRAVEVERSAEPVVEAKVDPPASRSAEPSGAPAQATEPAASAEPIELPDEVMGEEIIIEIED